jgi:hypothetical protein
MSNVFTARNLPALQGQASQAGLPHAFRNSKDTWTFSPQAMTESGTFRPCSEEDLLAMDRFEGAVLNIWPGLTVSVGAGFVRVSWSKTVQTPSRAANLD